MVPKSWRDIPCDRGSSAICKPRALDGHLTAASVRDSEPLPRRRPDKLHAKKGYDISRCRHYLRKRGTISGIARRGIELDWELNAKSAPLISSQAGRVKVRVIRTDEELMIARSVAHVLDLGQI